MLLDEHDLATHQVDEVCGDRAVRDADGDTLRGTHVFSRVLHPQEVHPFTCRRKSHHTHGCTSLRSQRSCQKYHHGACGIAGMQLQLEFQNQSSPGELGSNSISSPLGTTKLIGDGQAASMKSQRRGLNKCFAGSSCFRLEIQSDMGRS